MYVDQRTNIVQSVGSACRVPIHWVCPFLHFANLHWDVQDGPACLTLARLFVKGRLNRVALGWYGGASTFIAHAYNMEGASSTGACLVVGLWRQCWQLASMNQVASRKKWLVWVWEFAEVDITEFILWYIPCMSVILSWTWRATWSSSTLTLASISSIIRFVKHMCRCTVILHDNDVVTLFNVHWLMLGGIHKQHHWTMHGWWNYIEQMHGSIVVDSEIPYAL